MSNHAEQSWSVPNPKLKSLGILIGEWDTVGTHPLVEEPLRGHASFAWLEGGAFLIQRSEILNDSRFPKGITIFGSDDAAQQGTMLYFDERGVSRVFEWTLVDNVLKWWRNAPGFSQRYSGTIVDQGNTIIGKGELCEDGVTWKPDLDLTYTRTR